MAKTSWEDEKKVELLNILNEQIKTEGQLVGLYEDYVRKTENKVVKRMMHMISLDSKKHIDLIQACIEIIEGEDVFIDDKREVRKSLKKHLELEEESIKMARKAIDQFFVTENEGLNELLHIWLDDERKHHKVLKSLSEKTYFRLGFNDFVQLFRDEAFLEERYRRMKRFQEKKS